MKNKINIDFKKSIVPLLQGEREKIADQLAINGYRPIFLYVGIIFLCGGIYGYTVGVWRSQWQAVFVAIKFPLLIILTVIGNGLINWMLSLIFGLNMTFKQSLIIILMSFTIACIILSSLAPAIAFMTYCIPSSNSQSAILAVSIVTVMHVVTIAVAGVISNIKLFQLLVFLGNRKLAQKILFSWLAINLFLGAQLSWNLRPFIGTPTLEVQFLRPDAFRGNFYEDVYHKITNITSAGG